MEPWRLLVDPSAAGARNMAIDQAVAEAVQCGAAPPTLRFYTWWPRALSLGYHQSLRLVDRPLAQHLGIDIVRRITGGGALLHGDELTYAVAVPRRHRLVRGGVRASYAALTQGLIAGLEALGLTPRSGAGPIAPAEARPDLCFSSPSTHEIWIDGRKMVASAQGRVHGGVLQHGSVVLSHDLDVHRLTHTPLPRARPSRTPRRRAAAGDRWRAGAGPRTGLRRPPAHGAAARHAHAGGAPSQRRVGRGTVRA